MFRPAKQRTLISEYALVSEMRLIARKYGISGYCSVSAGGRISCPRPSAPIFLLPAASAPAAPVVLHSTHGNTLLHLLTQTPPTPTRPAVVMATAAPATPTAATAAGDKVEH